jgi:Tfp pilus assembly protein PilF/ADP-heptose:LPS heptosyltransferase
VSKPRHLSPRMALVVAWLDSGQFDLALATLERLVQDEPDLNACLLLGSLHMQKGALEPAAAAFQKALTFDACNFKALHELGVIEGLLGHHAIALIWQEKALALNPDSASLQYNLGCTLDRLGRHKQAVEAFDASLRLAPRHAGSWYNKALALSSMGQVSQEVIIDCYRNAIAAEPALADAHLNLGHLLLEKTDFANGWAEYGWRWQSPEFTSPPLQKTQLKAWDGTTFAPSLLVWREQGIGDEILYSTMLADLRKLAGEIHVLTDQRLIPLLSRTHPDMHFHAAGPTPRAPEVSTLTHHIPMGSLGQHLRRSTADFQTTVLPQLVPDAARAAQMRASLDQTVGASGLVCGLSWQSTTQQGVSKGFPLTALLPLLEMPGLAALDLQYQNFAEERSSLLSEHGIRVHRQPDLDHRLDIDGLAALIQCCQVVVTCSTTTAHLAGVIGKPTLLLLPRRKGKFWYWHHLQGRSLWYPSVRVFEQTADGQWDDVVRRIKDVIQSEFLGLSPTK